MLCQSCKKRDATRHESVRSEDGKTWSEVHLCDQCSEKGEGLMLTQAGLVQALLEGVGALAPPTSSELTTRACPRCGITYQEFRTRGRLGCPEDYDVFLSDLLPLLERIHHGGTQHMGKNPVSPEGRSEGERELIDARRALAEAVQKEEYEAAAKLRDRIRTLEEARGKGGGAAAGEAGPR